MKKKLISVTVFLAILVQFAIPVFAANTYLVSNNFSAAVADNTAPSGLLLYKIGGDHPWNTSYTAGGVGGKDANDRAFFIKTTDYDGREVSGYPGGDPFLGAYSTVNNKDVTFEASLLGPYEGMRNYLSIGIDGDMYDMMSLNDDGSIVCNFVRVGTWKTGRWYKLAATFHAGTKCVDFYLNGEKVLENSVLTTANMSSFTRIKLIALTTNASTTNIKSNLTGYDNVKWYEGQYNHTRETVAGSTDSKIYIHTPTTAASLCEQAKTGANSFARVYTDSTFTAVNDGNLSDGNVLAVGSANGEVIKYYDIVNMRFSSDFDVDNDQLKVSVFDSMTVGTFLDNLKGTCSFKVVNQYGVEQNRGEELSSDMKLCVISQNKANCQFYSILAGNGTESGKGKLVSSIYSIDDDTVSGIADGTAVAALIADIMKENKNEYIKVYKENGVEASKVDAVSTGMTLETASGKVYKLINPKLALNETFEEYPVGSLARSRRWNVEEKAATGGSIKIAENKGNKYLLNKIAYTSSAANDSFVQSGTINLADKAVISVKAVNTSQNQGWVNLLLRDTVNSSSAGSLILFTLFEDKISYLPYITKTSDSVVNETISTSELSEINVRINGKKLQVYKGNVLKATAEDYSASLSVFRADTCQLRVQTFVAQSSGKTAEIQCDDIKIYTNAQTGISAENTIMKYNNAATTDIKNGTAVITSTVHNSFGESKEIKLAAAVYEGNTLKDLKMSEPTAVDANSAANMAVSVTLDEVSPNTSLKVMAWSDGGSMIPLQQYSSFVKHEYSADELEAMFNETSAGVHPRVLANKSDFDRIIAMRNTDSNVADWADYVIHWAGNIVNDFTTTDTTSWCYVGYLKDDTQHILEISRRVKLFSIALGMAYKLTGDMKYVNKDWEIINAAAAFPDWDSVHFLDTAEMTAGFAVAYDWMFDAWTDAQKKTMENAIINMGLKEGEAGFKSNQWWTTTDNNWNAVCSGGLLMGAVAVADIAPDTAFPMMERNIKAVKNAMQSFAPDGAWFEGPGYWHYAVEYLAKMLSTCEKSLGSDLGIMDYECVRKTQSFIVSVDGNNGLNNFHDSGEGLAVHLNSPEMFWISNKLNNNITANARLAYLKGNIKNCSPLDLLWYTPTDSKERVDLPTDSYFRDVELINMRNTWEKGSTWLSAHAGKSAVNHSHLDCGAFVFDSQGQSFALDLGCEKYALPGYFDMGYNSNRWKYYRLRAEGHNTLVINPSQAPDQALSADTKVTEFVSRAVNPYTVMDLSTAYPGNTVSRGMMLADNRKSLVVRDQISLGTDNSSVYWFMNTRANMTQTEDGIVLEQNGKKVMLTYSTNASNVNCSIVDSKPLCEIDGSNTPNPSGQISNDGFKKVMIKIIGSGNINITVKLTPMDGNTYNDISDFDTNLTNWQSITQ